MYQVGTKQTIVSRVCLFNSMEHSKPHENLSNMIDDFLSCKV